MTEIQAVHDATLEEAKEVNSFRNPLPLLSPWSPAQEVARDVVISCIHHRPEGWRFGEMTEIAEFMLTKVEPCVDEVAGTILRSRVVALEAMVKANEDSAIRLSLGRWSPPIEMILLNEAHRQARAREAILWCAVERYRLKYGRLPYRLEDLVPEYLEKLPCDPVTGDSLVFLKKGDRDYLVYSIGWNRRDDGGIAGMALGRADWVWASNPALIVNPDEERERANELKAEAAAEKWKGVTKQRSMKKQP